jgi:hypothetical protein
MRKLTFLLLIFNVAIAWLFLKDAKALKLEKNYTLVSETTDKIPATVYYRNVDVKVGDKTENVYEIVIFFDKKLNMNLNPIVIVPKFKLIGFIDGGERGFFRLGNKIIQLSDESNKFIMLNDAVFFDDPPIKKIIFQEKSIIFNSFEGLTKYGQTIILKK